MADRLVEPWTHPFPPEADKADILACFRLILGRNPNPEEWPGHSDRAGESLPAVVSSYLNSLEFARRGLLASSEAAPEVAQHDGFRIHASADDPAVGRHVLAGLYEPEVAAVFRAVLRPGMGVVDLGANIGFFTMLAASLVGPAGAVLAVEPNPRNARMVEASRRLNGFEHVTVLQVAAGRDTGLLAINTSFTNGTTSALGSAPGSAPGSTGSGTPVLEADTVGCLAVDRVVRHVPPVGLLKLDVEGAEYNALLGCQALIRRDRPVIVMEFGPAQLPGISGVTGEELLGWLVAQGYALEIIMLEGPPVPVGQDTAAVMAEYARRGRDHIDILARPAAAVPSVRGALRRLLRRT